jgi:hypothetical protein
MPRLLTAVALAAMLMPGTAMAQSAPRPVRIGLLLDMSGP